MGRWWCSISHVCRPVCRQLAVDVVQDPALCWRRAVCRWLLVPACPTHRVLFIHFIDIREDDVDFLAGQDTCYGGCLAQPVYRPTLPSAVTDSCVDKTPGFSFHCPPLHPSTHLHCSTPFDTVITVRLASVTLCYCVSVLSCRVTHRTVRCSLSLHRTPSSATVNSDSAQVTVDGCCCRSVTTDAWGWPSEGPELCAEGGPVNHSWCVGVSSHGYGGLGGGRDWDGGWYACVRKPRGWSHVGDARALPGGEGIHWSHRHPGMQLWVKSSWNWSVILERP